MTTLKFKWTVSRGRDTYGYNICSLWVNGRKVSSCNGGGYDMNGTSLGLFIADRYSDRLLALDIPMNRRNGEDIREYYGLSYHDPKYQTRSNVPTETETIPHIDGACGFSSVERIMQAIGLTLSYVDGTRNQQIYILNDNLTD